MKKLGKLTALWLCWELWSWLAENPDKDKEDWPKWSFNNGRIEGNRSVVNMCFACRYRDLQYRPYRYCDENCLVPALRDGCSDNKSPFRIWVDSFTIGIRKKYARIIANSAYKEYKRLGGKKRK